MLSTGEDVPRGHSVQARVLLVEVPVGAISEQGLTDCQDDAAQDLYAEAMAGFLHWLAPRYDDARKTLPKMIAEWRSTLYREGHRRTPEIIANLLVGLHYFTEFAVSIGAMTEEERGAMARRGRTVLMELMPTQAEHHGEEEPVTRFRSLLRAALVRGEAHVAFWDDGSQPALDECMPLGWQKRCTGVDEDNCEKYSFVPQGKLVGWVDNDALFLDPESAYTAAQGLATRQRQPLGVSKRMLWRHLDEAGLLKAKSPGRGSFYRQRVEGLRRDTIALGTSFVVERDSLEVPEVPPPQPEGPTTAELFWSAVLFQFAKKLEQIFKKLEHFLSV
jgi:hypothetical protein